MRRILALPLAFIMGCAPVIRVPGDASTATVGDPLPEIKECIPADLAELENAPDCDYLAITFRNSRGNIYFQMRENGGCRELYYDFDADGKLDSYWARSGYIDLYERFTRLGMCPQAR
jgi:hypothetical protein